LNTVDLTASKLEELGRGLKGQFQSKQPDVGTVNKAIKERSIGQGSSPSSSVRTTYTGTRRRPSVAPPKSQVEPESTVLDQSDIVRPPTIGKRLFEPDSDSPFAAQSPLPSKTHRRRNSPQNPLQRSVPTRARQTTSKNEPRIFSAPLLANSTQNLSSSPQT
jgi:hypothetical protein